MSRRAGGRPRRGLAFLALRLALAQADDRHQAGRGGGARLRGDGGVGLVMRGAALRMADDDIRTTEVGQHGRGDVAGVRALGLAVAILAADRDRRAGERLAERSDQGRGRADEHVARRGFAADMNQQRRREALRLDPAAVHLPVAGDQLLRHPCLPCCSGRDHNARDCRLRPSIRRL